MIDVERVVTEGVVTMKAYVDRGFADVVKLLDQIEARLEAIEKRLAAEDTKEPRHD